MNCSTTNLVCKSKTGITPADVSNFDTNPPKTRNSCKSDDDNLVKDVREISGHINGNRHCETYSIVGMTSPILKLVEQVNQRKSRREDLHRRIDLCRKDDWHRTRETRQGNEGRLMMKILLIRISKINFKLLYLPTSFFQKKHWYCL